MRREWPALGAALALFVACGFALHHGFYTDHSTGSGVLTRAQDALQIVTLLVVWIAFARGPATRERFVRYAAGTVTAYVALGKVLSPQYLIWLVPLVPLVYGRRGTIAAGLLAFALVATQFWFPFRYFDLRDLDDALAASAVLVRDVSLLVLLAVLLVPLSRPTPPSAPIPR